MTDTTGEGRKTICAVCGLQGEAVLQFVSLFNDADVHLGGQDNETILCPCTHCLSTRHKDSTKH